MSVTFDGLEIFANNRHGWPMEMSPQAHVIAQYFWGTQGEYHLLGGYGSRPLIVNGIFGKSDITTFSTFKKRKNQLDTKIGKKITSGLQVSIGSTSDRWDHVYLAMVEPVPASGQKLAVPLLDVVGGTVGPAGGGYWMELNLHFIQVEI